MKKQLYLPHQKRCLPGHWGLWLLVWLLTAATADAQTIRYVKPDGTGTGSSWAQASADLQAMINASLEGDQVWVAGGTYKPGGNTNTDRTISFSMKSGVGIYGGFAGTETTLNERPASVTLGQPSSSILSGDIGAIGPGSDNSRYVVHNTNINSTAILDGVILTGGWPELTEEEIVYKIGGGGGMRNKNSSPTVRNCFFINNGGGGMFSNLYGGGLFNDGGSNPVLTNCTFDNNRTQVAGAISSVGSFTLINCTFTNNRSTASSPVTVERVVMNNCTFSDNINQANSSPMGVVGGAAAIGNGSILTNCLFSNNQADGRGGALWIKSNATLTNCTFRGNRTTDNAGGFNVYGYGGAIYGGTATTMLTNCSFSGNRSAGTRYAGGGAVSESDATFINCSFGNNSTGSQGGAFFSGYPKLISCIVWGNTPNGISNFTGSATLTYTDNQDGIPGIGNFKADPLFVDAPGDNLRLRACSPAIDKGDNSVSIGSTDLAGNPRRARTIDLGAYEFQGTPLLPVAVTQQPNRSYSIPQGGTLTASTSTTGAVAGYQWYRDGAALMGNTSATSATLTIANLAPSDDGHYYMVVTGSCTGDRDTSNTFRLYVNTGMYTVKTGSWDDPTVWALNRIPISTDLVRIKHLVTIPAGYVAHARRVSYDTGQRLRLGSKGRLWFNH